MGRNDTKPISPEIRIKYFNTLNEAEDFIDWIENNIDREGVRKGDYYIDGPESGMPEIKEAMVILSSACDKVYLETDLPCPFVKNFLPKQPPLTIQFDTTYDTGVQYVRDNFGLDPEVINTRN